MEELNDILEMHGAGPQVSKDIQACFNKLEKENKELKDFKEFTNMMIRRNLNGHCADYTTIMAIDEKLLEGDNK